MDDTVIIEHDEHGRVEGVRREGIAGCVWEKYGALYFDTRGWREVPKPKWVPVKCDYNADKLIVTLSEHLSYSYHLPDGYRWKTAEIEREAER